MSGTLITKHLLIFILKKGVFLILQKSVSHSKSKLDNCSVLFKIFFKTYKIKENDEIKDVFLY